MINIARLKELLRNKSDNEHYCYCQSDGEDAVIACIKRDIYDDIIEVLEEAEEESGIDDMME